MPPTCDLVRERDPNSSGKASPYGMGHCVGMVVVVMMAKVEQPKFGHYSLEKL